MSDLKSIIAFWYDCLKTENALEQSFGLKKSFELTARTKAMIFDGYKDPFIFQTEEVKLPIVGEKLASLISRATLRHEEIYYGYPLLTFIEQAKLCVAPLFVIRLEVDNNNLVAAEQTATLGSCALSKLGLRQEEITALNDEITQVFRDSKPSMQEDIVRVLDRELTLKVSEVINPNSLNRNDSAENIQVDSIYNRAVLFTAEASPYNLHLLSDLDKLRQKNDLQNTSLSYLTGSEATQYDESFIPILPFKYDPYQIKAIQAILANKHTVVSGPPGTGKSQFIANLIVNLSMQRKKILLVSHTTDAIKVVNDRIGQNFECLIMQTGRKELRQKLIEQLNKMVKDHNSSQMKQTKSATMRDVEVSWLEIINKSSYIVDTDSLIENISELQANIKIISDHKGIFAFIQKFILSLKINRRLKILGLRRDSTELQEEIIEAQQQHVERSRQYVSSHYLQQMFGSGNYGQLVSYIESVQSRRALYGSSDPAERYINSALDSVNVWSCTLNSVGANFPLQSGLFDYVIFDEASQIDLPSAAPALYRANSAVIVGDERQLTHITKINEEVEESLAKIHGIFPKDYYPGLVSYRGASLFTSAKHALHDTEQILLNHYRSNRTIASLFNRVFYNGELHIYEPDEYLPKEIKAGAYWVDTRGESQKYATGSRYNEAEANKIISLLKTIVPIANAHNLTIGVTTPYSRQQHIILSMVEEIFDKEALKNIRVLTVHKFQGSEVDILLFSTVIAKKGNAGSASWYKMNPEILNVAISRARQLLIIVGDREHSLMSGSKLKDISEAISSPVDELVKTKPMNIFEKKLYDHLINLRNTNLKIYPQYIVDGRYTVDFALLSNDKKIAVELDGYQHQIIGSIAIFEDSKRDKYLKSNSWEVVRIPIQMLLKTPELIDEHINQLLS